MCVFSVTVRADVCKKREIERWICLSCTSSKKALLGQCRLCGSYIDPTDCQINRKNKIKTPNTLGGAVRIALLLVSQNQKRQKKRGGGVDRANASGTQGTDTPRVIEPPKKL